MREEAFLARPGAFRRNYCCLEFEGKEKPDLAVAKSIALLRKTIGA